MTADLPGELREGRPFSLVRSVRKRSSKRSRSWPRVKFLELESSESETIRAGAPANPSALLPGQSNGPVLGMSWDPRIDHTSFMQSDAALA